MSDPDTTSMPDRELAECLRWIARLREDQDAGLYLIEAARRLEGSTTDLRLPRPTSSADAALARRSPEGVDESHHDTDEYQAEVDRYVQEIRDGK